MSLPYIFRTMPAGNVPAAELDDNFAACYNYTPSGTGAVVTTVAGKLQQTVSVKDFGATGNGSMDDTAAVQLSLNSGATAIYFPQGTYLISSTLTATWSGIDLRLYGAGAGVSTGPLQGSVLKFTGTGPLLTYDGAGTSTSFTIDDLKFYTTNAVSQTFGLKLYNSYVNYINRCVFEGFSYQSGTTLSAGIWLTGPSTTDVVNRIYNCSFTLSYVGLYADIQNSNLTTVRDNYFYSNSYGIRVGDLSSDGSAFVKWLVSGNDFEANTVSDVYTEGARGLTISDNYFEWTGNKTPITLQTNVSSPLNSGIVISGNTFAGSLAAGRGFIEAASTNGITVFGNFQAISLATTQFLVKSLGTVSDVHIQAQPDVPSSLTAVAAYQDNAGVTHLLEYDSLNVPIAFTPVVQGGSTTGTTTYTTQIGYYVKRGDLVEFHIELAWTAQTGTGALTITGFPFNALSGTQPVGMVQAGSDGTHGLTYTSGNQLSFRMYSGAGFAYIWQAGTGGAATQLAVTSNTSGSFIVTGSYIAAPV